MSKVIVIGAGFSGSAAALMLAADGQRSSSSTVMPARYPPGPMRPGSGTGEASANIVSPTACCHAATG